jgi:DNA-binding beta-propeller fold protein YncE
MVVAGGDIWVALTGKNRLVRLRGQDGFVRDSQLVGHGPAGVAFDGTNVWVTNSGSHTISRR